MRSRALASQTRIELTLSARQGEQLLVSIGIPLLLLVFFSTVDILPLGTDRAIDGLTPAVLALAVMSSSMVSLGIGTAFERHYGVLKRLGATPLGRPTLLTAKIAAIVVTEVVQLAVLATVAMLLGWDPSIDAIGLLAAVIAGTAAFAGLGLFLAGSLSGPANLAACNGLYLLLLLFGGVVVPPDELPAGVRQVAGVLPSGALVEVMRDVAGGLAPASGSSWLVLAAWAVILPVVASRTFSWQPRA